MPSMWRSVKKKWNQIMSNDDVILLRNPKDEHAQLFPFVTENMHQQDKLTNISVVKD